MSRKTGCFDHTGEMAAGTPQHGRVLRPVVAVWGMAGSGARPPPVTGTSSTRTQTAAMVCIALELVLPSCELWDLPCY